MIDTTTAIIAVSIITVIVLLLLPAPPSRGNRSVHPDVPRRDDSTDRDSTGSPEALRGGRFAAIGDHGSAGDGGERHH
jgi:hypothetical protein